MNIDASLRQRQKGSCDNTLSLELGGCKVGNSRRSENMEINRSVCYRIRNKAGQTCAELAGKSSCPGFKLELEKLEMQKNKELQETEGSAKSRPEFLKPVKKITKKVIRAPSLEGYLNIPSNLRRSPSPLATMSAGSPGTRSLRGVSPQVEASNRKIKLVKRPSVDSGINLDSQTVKNTNREKKNSRQLSK